MKKMLEHKDVRRGDLSIILCSPSGMVSHLLPRRPRDFINTVGYKGWPFMSVLHWGEEPHGLWQVNVSYMPSVHARQQGYATVTELNLTLHGTVLQPQAVKSIPQYCHRKCASKCGGAGPGQCDTCQSLRNIQTLECVENCWHGDETYERFCLPSSNRSHSPYQHITTSPVATTSQPNSSIATAEITSYAWRNSHAVSLPHLLTTLIIALTFSSYKSFFGAI